MDDDWQNKFFGAKDRLGYILKNEILADVKFSFSDEQKILCAHKLLLASASPVFMQMFYGQLAENTNLPIKIEEIDSQTFSTMLKYIYTDKIELETWNSALNVYCAAKKYMIDALKIRCVEFIVEKLEAIDALTAYEFGNFHEEDTIRDVALKVIREKTISILESPNFLQSDISTMSKILEQDELEADEVQLFNALESLALARNIFGRSESGNNSTDAGHNSDDCLLKFREAVKKINFLDMSAKEFSNGPVFSKLLQEKESLAILACLAEPSNIPTHYPKGFVQKRNKESLPRVFFDISANGLNVGRIIIELRSDVVPHIIIEKFLEVCMGNKAFRFKGGYFNNISADSTWYRAKAVRFSNENATRYIEFEHFKWKDTEAGSVGLCSGKGKIDVCQFYIICAKDRSQYSNVIGLIIEGMEVLNKFKSFATESGEPSKKIIIEDCGII